MKLSLLAESAGRGAFLIEGYYRAIVSLENLTTGLVAEVRVNWKC